VLFASTGIKNYGPYLEKIRVGIVSDIQVDGTPLHSYATVVGLNGEQYRKQGRALQPSAPRDLPFTAAVNTSSAQPLTWYKATFPTPAAATAPDAALALDLSATALVKGAVWVNDVMLGRYWNILASTSGGSCGKFELTCIPPSHLLLYYAVGCVSEWLLVWCPLN
jgi:hypothetical protein